MWELDHKEGRALRNWRFRTVVLVKTLESPLDCKEIKQVSPKGNQHWIFIRRTDVEAPTLWPPMRKVDSLEKILMLGKIEGRRIRGNRGWDGWMTSLTQWTWTWANSGRWWMTGKPGVPQSTGLWRVRNNFGHWTTKIKKWKLLIELHWPIKALWWHFPPVASVQFSRSVMSKSGIPWTAAHQASLSITNSQSLLKLMTIESVMPSNHLILCCPLLPPSILPSIRVFSNESVLHISWPSIGISASASVLPMNIQD